VPFPVHRPAADRSPGAYRRSISDHPTWSYQLTRRQSARAWHGRDEPARRRALLSHRPALHAGPRLGQASTTRRRRPSLSQRRPQRGAAASRPRFVGEPLARRLPPRLSARCLLPSGTYGSRPSFCAVLDDRSRLVLPRAVVPSARPPRSSSTASAQALLKRGLPRALFSPTTARRWPRPRPPQGLVTARASSTTTTLPYSPHQKDCASYCTSSVGSSEGYYEMVADLPRVLP
jgi:hypothetical protein